MNFFWFCFTINMSSVGINFKKDEAFFAKT